MKKLWDKKNFIFVLLAIYFSVFLIYAWYSHVNLKTSLFDLGLQEQVIWNTSEGRFFESSPEVENFLGDHFSLLFIPVALIYKIFPSTLTLFIIQCFAITLGILGFYKLAEYKIKDFKIRLLVLFGMLVYWPLSSALTFDFHEITLAFPFLAWGIYLIEINKRGLLKFVLLFFAILAKEDVGIFIGMLGLYYLLFKKEKWGAIMFILGLAWSVLCLFVFMPHFRSDESSDTLMRYSYLGGIFSDPIGTIKTFVSSAKLIYLLKLFVPFFPIILILPKAMILLGPSFAINFLSQEPSMVSAGVHYDVILSAGIFFLNIIAWENISLKKATLFKPILLCIYILMLIVHPVWREFINIENRASDYQYIQEIKASIPKESSVLVSNSLGAQFSHYQNLYLLDPAWLDRGLSSKYIIIDTKEYSGSRNYLINTEYDLLEEKGNIQVYVKKQSTVFSNFLYDKEDRTL